MMAIMRNPNRKPYFKAFCLKDGTPFMAIPTRRPLPKTLANLGEQIDEDGVWNRMRHEDEELDEFINSARHLVYATIANALNVNRAIRRQVEPKLANLTEQVTFLNERLGRIEQKLDAVMNPES